MQIDLIPTLIDQFRETFEGEVRPGVCWITDGRPDSVAAACLRIAKDLGLLHAGIDLKETPEGDWYCFEVNPCPGFIYYERHTGQPISLALAELLHTGIESSPEPAAMN